MTGQSVRSDKGTVGMTTYTRTEVARALHLLADDLEDGEVVTEMFEYRRSEDRKVIGRSVVLHLGRGNDRLLKEELNHAATPGTASR